jgi:hypothetical protein
MSGKRRFARSGAICEGLGYGPSRRQCVQENDAVRALQSARDGGLDPTGMEVAIAADGSVVFRVFTDRTMQPPSKEVMTSAEWDEAIGREKAAAKAKKE